MSLTLGQIQVETFARSLKQKVSVLSNFTQVSLLKKKKKSYFWLLQTYPGEQEVELFHL